MLFKEGRHVQTGPVKLIYMESNTELDFDAQAMFVVPKRMFKKAHDRNKLRRRMKEVYRLNKVAFYGELKIRNKKMILAFLFTGKKIESYDMIRDSIAKLIAKLLK